MILLLYIIYFFSCLFEFIQSGHINVDDIFLTYQNEGYIKGCHIYFSMENHLEKNEYFKIYFPINFTSLTPYFTTNFSSKIDDIDLTSFLSLL